MRLSVIAPGQPVDVVQPTGTPIRAYVCGIDIRYPDRVMYEVVYWVEEERVKEWVEGFEVAPVDESATTEILGS